MQLVKVSSAGLRMRCFMIGPGSGVTMEGFIGILDRYMVWYNEKRIKLSLGGMSPLAYRLSLGLAA
jgi:transposase InsO family protein